jgi:modification methylase
MPFDQLPLDQIVQGDCVEVLKDFPERSIDLVFADPPYFLQLEQELWRPNQTKVDRVDDEWDQFSSWEDYDRFSREWLSECRRILKDSGTIWVIGTYHNIYRLGALMQDLGFWFLNDLVWIKTNPMPNFRGVRFTNAHETLLWATKQKKSKYTFNYHAMKELNGGVQMRSDWHLPICNGPERMRVDGKKVHSTQKPESLLYRVLLASSNPGDIVLDPFFGMGTTGAVAKVLHRRWIGIEKDIRYIEFARKRIEQTQVEAYDPKVFDVRDARRRQPRVPFNSLLENRFLIPGQILYFKGERSKAAIVLPDGRLRIDGADFTIHQAARHLSRTSPHNGWELWFFETEQGELLPIDYLREAYRASIRDNPPDAP